jgi:hypothetical protein
LLTPWSQAAPSAQESLSPQEKDFNLRYARASLELARFNLQNALDTNGQVPNTYPGAAIVALREAVAISEAAVQEAGRGNARSWRQVQIRGAEAALQAAQANLQRAQALASALQNAPATAGVQRARLAVNVAQIRLERARAMSGAPALSDLDWQFYDLRMQILQVSGSIQ